MGKDSAQEVLVEGMGELPRFGLSHNAALTSEWAEDGPPFLTIHVLSLNAPAVTEPASTIWFPGSATFPTEIWLLSSARGKAGWDEGRESGLSRKQIC